MSPKACVSIDLDVPTRTIRMEVSANPATIDEMIAGLQALKEGRTEGYAIVTKSMREPGSVALLIRKVDLAEDTLSFTLDGIVENDHGPR